MLNSKEFWSQGAYHAKVKTPFEMVASSVRALDAKVEDAFALANQVGNLGEPLYRKQEPTGYSNLNSEWVNSAALLGTHELRAESGAEPCSRREGGCVEAAGGSRGHRAASDVDRRFTADESIDRERVERTESEESEAADSGAAGRIGVGLAGFPKEITPVCSPDVCF